MSDRALIVTGRTTAAAGVALGAASAPVAAATGELTFWWRSFGGVQACLGVAFGVFVWLVVARQPRNATVWAMAGSAGASIAALVLALVPNVTDGDPLDLLDEHWVPADSPPAVGWLLVAGNAASIPGLFVPLTLGLLLFPNGALPSPRWRAPALIVAATSAVLAVSHGWWYRPDNDSRAEGPIILGSAFLVVIFAALALLSLAGRYRRSTGAERQQYKWVVWGTSVGVAVFAGFFFVPDRLMNDDGLILVASLAAVWWVYCYGVAVGRYRLYDIDVVISRGVVFLSLAALITGSYVLVVVVIGSRVGGSDVWLSVLATALVAMAFEPVRTRSQRGANRLVYGRRATPYEVLGELSRLLAVAESAEELLARLTADLRAATGSRRVVVWTLDGTVLRPVAADPPTADGSEAPSPGPGASSAEFPVEHEGETLGYLTVDEAAGAPLRPHERHLAADLAAAAALVVAKVRLDRDLAAKAKEIDDSRRRLVDAEDNERRRLERELNERIAARVAALEAQLQLAERLSRDEGCVRAAALLGRLGVETHAASDQIRSLAQGLHPSLLSTEGLVPAVRALAARCPLEVRVDLDVDRRYPASIEAAVYYCLSEALTNATKHAKGPAWVAVLGRAESLEFTVSDAGPGFDPAGVASGSGLHNLVDRLDTLGGTVSIDSCPGANTCIRARLPVEQPLIRSSSAADPRLIAGSRRDTAAPPAPCGSSPAPGADRAW